MEQIEQFLREHPATGLVVIDTLQCIRGAGSEVNSYASDYQDIGVLKALADRHRIAVLLVHHLRKLSDDDPISCQWETAATTSTGITGFSINGVAGAVNNTTNTITITMPRGTDVTKLTPVIATNGVKSLTPGSGETVDFTNSVTYTAIMEDGSTKAYIVTVYVNKGTLSDQFWDKMTDFTNQVPWWEYAKNQQSTSSYPKYW